MGHSATQDVFFPSHTDSILRVRANIFVTSASLRNEVVDIAAAEWRRRRHMAGDDNNDSVAEERTNESEPTKERMRATTTRKRGVFGAAVPLARPKVREPGRPARCSCSHGFQQDALGGAKR